MEYYYLIIVVVLFALAVSDLIVGVSNDAVNFLNSAIGSKAAPFKIIMAVAALGILVGATFSGGMMEVARKGIFHPDMFFFKEIMIIFMAVMITDIILLDMFNTYGLPTSTTVSIVFELLGAAVAVSAIKVFQATEGIGGLAEYINSSRALGIISGIFFSILVAFSVGAIIQWIVRLLFSFNISKTLKYWGGLWGGIAISAIVYFLLVKGAKGATFMNDSTVDMIQNNSFRIILYSFIGGTIIFQSIIFFTKVNVLKVIVLFGTFALAMAFAGNDLVNFIGVPLAGYESYKAFAASGAEPGGYLMDILREPVRTPAYFLLIAGLIMAVTLRFSKKARTVTVTEISLGSQNEGSERFESNAFARFLVRLSVDINKFSKKYTPLRVQRALDARFDPSSHVNKDKQRQEVVAFDLVRASVNLVVASILISIATNMKLPLSTTYVTFMVSMGSSLSDRAWGRESAVYRISGVITVIGGWFLTAFSAFTAAFILAMIIYMGGMVAIVALLILAVFMIYRTHMIHKKREIENGPTSKAYFEEASVSTENVIESCSDTVTRVIVQVSKLYYMGILNFTKENRKELKDIRKQVKQLNKETKKLKNNIHVTIRKIEEDEIESGHYYVQVLDYLRETTNCLQFLVNPMYNHVDNNHPMLNKQQVKEFLNFNEKMSEYFNYALTILKNNSFESIDELKEQRDNLLEMSNNLRKKQIKHLKKVGKGTKVSLVFLDIMTESKNMLLFITNIVEANRAFIEHGEKEVISR